VAATAVPRSSSARRATCGCRVISERCSGRSRRAS